MKGALEGITGQLVQALVLIVVLAAVVYVIYRKLNSAASPYLDAAVDAAAPTLSKVLYGTSEEDYISTARQRELAEARLAEKRKLQAIGIGG